MMDYDLTAGLPDPLAAMPQLYLLGVGGPEDASGIGHVESFVWRFHALERAGEPLAVFGFTGMAQLMALTRAVNADRQGALPTEVLRVKPADVQAPLPVRLWVDVTAGEYHAIAAGRQASEARLVGLEGRVPS